LVYTDHKHISHEEEAATDLHLVDLDILCKRFNTSLLHGKTEAAARLDLEMNGPNRLTPPAQTPEWVKFCKHLFGGFSLLLWCGALLCFASYGIQSAATGDSSKDNLYLGLVLSFVVVTTAVFSYHQESKSSQVSILII
jgi:sodium/potassium-transporting ATPase subunit alpha